MKQDPGWICDEVSPVLCNLQFQMPQILSSQPSCGVCVEFSFKEIYVSEADVNMASVSHPWLDLWTCFSNMASNLWYKAHQIPKLKCSSSRLAVVFAQPIEARC